MGRIVYNQGLENKLSLYYRKVFPFGHGIGACLKPEKRSMLLFFIEEVSLETDRCR